MEALRIDTDIFCIKDFMSIEEAKKWIYFSEEQGYELAKVNMGFRRQVVNKGIRNNQRVIYDNETLAKELWQRVKPFVIPEIQGQIAFGLNERFRFYKYRVGEEFRPHRDGSFVRNSKERSAYTLLIYLNDTIEGGETAFPKHVIQPKTGAAIIFKHEIRHAGLPIKKGIKYVLRTDIMYRSVD